MQGPVHRQRILALARADPGVHVGHAARVLGLTANAVRHHVDMLVREDRLTTVPDGNRLCLFDRTGKRVEDKPLVLLLRVPRRLRVAQALLAHPGVALGELAAELEMASASVHRLLQGLFQHGLVQGVEDGRRRLLFPTEALERTLAQALDDGPPGPSDPEHSLLAPGPAEEPHGSRQAFAAT